MSFSLPQSIYVSGLFCLAISFPSYLNSQAGSETSSNELQSVPTDSIVIPGPLRSFLRMAGISQEVTPEDVLPMLARNVVLYGFDTDGEKEFLILVDRYVHQARDLERLSADGKIHISGCGDSAELLGVLGYKFQRPCGQKNTALVTANAERAFLTIDSGFPLTALEQALQKDGPFTYSFPATRVPIIFTEKEWLAAAGSKRKADNALLDLLLHNPETDRLYAAMARYDRPTRLSLSQSPGLKRLMLVATVTDLYGSQIRIKSGRVIVPGDNDKAWEDLLGESPGNPGQFVTKLLTRDSGWMAAYFDVLARLDHAQQEHLIEGNRLKRFYDVYRAPVANVDATKGIFPRNGELFILLASLKWKADGDFAIPGDVLVWEAILSQMAKSRQMRAWLGRGRDWNTSGRLLETLIASSNLQTETGPVQVFLLLNALNSLRPPEHQLSDETDKLVASRFAQFHHWFAIFAEFPGLDDGAIAKFVNAADRIDSIPNPALRSNALGAFQADIGIWHIFARQGQIPGNKLNSSWQEAMQPFLESHSSVQFFEAGRSSLQASLQAAGGNGKLSQDEIIELLAGPVHDDRDSQRVHHDLAERIRSVLDDQRLVSLDTLFGLYDGMTEMAHGSATGNALLPLAENLREFEMPRPIFTGNERSTWAPIVYTSRHAELQVRTDLTKILKTSATPSQIEAGRGQLTPFLRDTLVGLNYAYYEPPGAEVLHNNPLFVRSHDFSSISVQGTVEIWGVPRMVGIGATAGGGAYLLGSLADLPYALASAEEDFIVPKNIQALIWKDIVPDLLVSATLPRWWNVSQNELHCAALYQRAGEELLSAAASNADLRQKVVGILADRMTPGRVERTAKELLVAGGSATVIGQTPPADVFYLAMEFRKRYPDQASMAGRAGQELDELAQKTPSDASMERLSADFGVPHPGLMITDSSALLNMKSISTFGGDAGRLFAESWDSNNLYWARLADEMGYSPAELNLLAPELTRNMVANIFASNIDDWSALLRAMEQTGDEFRKGKITLQAVSAFQQ
ncbi:MAG TPA: hypothetical protein VK574_08935 [Terracidiphilus sp.]|nr:hypothetical protein [Terracidiphilus sp.]